MSENKEHQPTEQPQKTTQGAPTPEQIQQMISQQGMTPDALFQKFTKAISQANGGFQMLFDASIEMAKQIEILQLEITKLKADLAHRPPVTVHRAPGTPEAKAQAEAVQNVKEAQAKVQQQSETEKQV